MNSGNVYSVAPGKTRWAREGDRSARHALPGLGRVTTVPPTAFLSSLVGSRNKKQIRNMAGDRV